MIDLAVTARHDGSDDAHGMTLAELEEALRRGRMMGATDATCLRVQANRNRRLRSIVLEIRDPDGEAPATPDGDSETGDGDPDAVPGQLDLEHAEP